MVKTKPERPYYCMIPLLVLKALVLFESNSGRMHGQGIPPGAQTLPAFWTVCPSSASVSGLHVVEVHLGGDIQHGYESYSLPYQV